jgi:hypothetical protein
LGPKCAIQDCRPTGHTALFALISYAQVMEEI